MIPTTHSPEMLDAFGDEPPTMTVVERVSGETVPRVIAGEQLEYWLKQYTLGELYRSKELEAMGCSLSSPCRRGDQGPGWKLKFFKGFSDIYPKKLHLE